MRKIVHVLLALVLAAAIIAAGGCGGQAKTEQASGVPKVKVVATVYPVYEFTRQVGGDKVEVALLVPPGAEPHDWEPKAKDVALIKGAKLLLYHGAGLEPAAKLLSKEILGDVPAVAVSKGVPLLTEHDQDAHAKTGHAHSHGGDPHVWLDPVLAQQEVDNIVQALANIDPANADYYRQNGVRFKGELSKLDEEYRQVLAKLPGRDIVTSHAAFGYLAKRYGLREIAIMGLAPDTEPTPDRMASIVRFCRENKVKYIFFETVVSPKLAETIARETGAGLLILNPLESLTEEELKQGKNYLSVMRDNLANLQKALAQ